MTSSNFENEVNNEADLLLAILFLSPILNSGFVIEYFNCKGKIPVDMDLL
jgi:hypothetical protein